MNKGLLLGACMVLLAWLGAPAGACARGRTDLASLVEYFLHPPETQGESLKRFGWDSGFNVRLDSHAFVQLLLQEARLGSMDVTDLIVLSRPAKEHRFVLLAREARSFRAYAMWVQGQGFVVVGTAVLTRREARDYRAGLRRIKELQRVKEAPDTAFVVWRDLAGRRPVTRAMQLREPKIRRRAGGGVSRYFPPHDDVLDAAWRPIELALIREGKTLRR